MEKRSQQFTSYEGIKMIKGYPICYSKQINIDYMVYIEPRFSQPKQLTKVWIKPNIRYKKLVENHQGISAEGQCLTGNKAIIMGELEYKMQYIATNKEETLHTQDRKIPFWADITLPKWVDMSHKLIGEVLVEDIYTQVIDSLSVYVAVSIVVAVKIG